MTSSQLRWQDAALVFVGGAVGTLARASLLLIDAPGWQQWGVMLINVVGGFALGALNGFLAGRADARARRARLLVGTGALGGFTTYSTFALIATGGWWIAIGAAVLVVGIALAWLGLRLGAALALRQRRGRSIA